MLFHPMLRPDERKLNIQGYIPLLGTHQGWRRLKSAQGFLSELKLRLNNKEFEGDLKNYNIKKLYWENHVGRGRVECYLPVLGGGILVIYDLMKGYLLKWTEPTPDSAFDNSSTYGMRRARTDFNLYHAALLNFKVRKVFNHVLKQKDNDFMNSHTFTAAVLKETAWVESETLNRLFCMYARSKGFECHYDIRENTLTLSDPFITT